MIPTKTFRIGTRDSKLALWQAKRVQQLLQEQGVHTELVPVKSDGDLDLVTPLYAMGVEGVFTKTLDSYLLSDKIDIAVHSMKDVPIQLPQGIVQAAVLERASYKDVLLCKDKSYADWDTESDMPRTIATGSVRRKAQWWNRFPNHKVENLRGNVQTRMQKLVDHNWDGAIFAAAGLERMEIEHENLITLDWMLPAPAQGAIMVVCRAESEEVKTHLSKLNHEETATCVAVERDFLAALMGGCATPISALATIENDVMHFEGNVLSPDGKLKFEVKHTVDKDNFANAGKQAAASIIEKGADAVMELIRQHRVK